MANRAQRAIDRLVLRGSVLIDAALTIQWLSPSVEAMLGWTADRAIGMSALEFVHPDDVEMIGRLLTYEEEVDPAYRVVLQRRDVREMQIKRADGTYRLLDVALANFYTDPEIGMLLIDFSAPTQFRLMERAIELSRIGADLSETLALVLEQFTTAEVGQPAAVILDAAGNIITATANTPAPFGSNRASEFRFSWEFELREVDFPEPIGLFRAWCQRDAPHPLDYETSERLARHAAVIVGHSLITRELRRAALVDPLTAVSNRRALQQELRQRLERNDDVLLGYLDLDGFKAVNDRLGHAAGDEVLRTVAARLRESLRGEDFVARIGGDEFVMLFGQPAPGIDVLSDRLSMLVGAPIAIGDDVLSISASVGFSSGRADADALLRAADREMLAVKQHQRE
jgi:diguanylate cyclase (GGDEF)-like protein/PAS domain S-box-containing protein